jgi:calpain
LREVTQNVTLSTFEGKSYGYYIIIPNIDYELRKGSNKHFWLRVFASEKIQVEEIPETLEAMVQGAWEKGCNGGPMTYEGKSNPFWC